MKLDYNTELQILLKLHHLISCFVYKTHATCGSILAIMRKLDYTKEIIMVSAANSNSCGNIIIITCLHNASNTCLTQPKTLTNHKHAHVHHLVESAWSCDVIQPTTTTEMKIQGTDSCWLPKTLTNHKHAHVHYLVESAWSCDAIQPTTTTEMKIQGTDSCWLSLHFSHHIFIP